MKIVTTPAAAAFIQERGGKVWVWLDPRRGVSAPTSGWSRIASRRVRAAGATSPAARSVPIGSRSRRARGVEVHHDFGRLDAPDELHFDVKGIRNKTKRLEAYWNGCVFVGPDVPAPAEDRRSYGRSDRIRSPFGSHSGSSATTAGTRSPNTSTSTAVPGTARSTGRYAYAMEAPTA